MRINVWVIGIISILVFPILINAFPRPVYINDSIADSFDVIDDPIFDQVEKSRIIQNLNNLDGYFTENRGQVGNDSVRYYIQGKGVWFLDDGVVFEIRDEISIYSRESGVKSRESELPFDPMGRLEPQVPAKYESVVLKLNFESANRVIPIGRGLLQYRSNFFYGNNSSKWCTDVPNYQEIIYENIYDNIDLRYYTTTKGLKYDFIVHPGGEPNDIMLRYEGTDGLKIDDFGNLIIETAIENLIDGGLFIYQNCDCIQKPIIGEFLLFNT